MMSTENFGKNKGQSVLNFLDVRARRWGKKYTFFIRDAFIRDEMMSTENFGKIRDGEYSNFSRYKG